jgi:uncharacterized protein
MSIPEEFTGQKYLSLATFRKTGAAVHTPVWFVKNDDRLYLFTNPKSGKVKRIRNNPRVRIAPCTMRGRLTGAEFEATARIVTPSEAEQGLRLMKKKYWLMRIPFLWSKDSIFMELTMA